MQKLDSKKIDSALKSLETAAKGALKSLNEMTGNSFKDSPVETDPLTHLGTISTTLLRAREQVKLEAQYEGMDDDQIAEAKEAERAQEREDLQRAIQEKLEKRKHVEPEPTEEVGEGDENLSPPSE